MICKQCGKEIPENSNFCTFCGAAQPVTEPVQEQAPQPEAPAPAAEPELVVEPGPAPEAPPAPELVFDLPVPEPEAAPAPKAEEPAPMPLPDPAPMPLPDPVADPAPKEEGPAPARPGAHSGERPRERACRRPAAGSPHSGPACRRGSRERRREL